MGHPTQRIQPISSGGRFRAPVSFFVPWGKSVGISAFRIGRGFFRDGRGRNCRVYTGSRRLQSFEKLIEFGDEQGETALILLLRDGFAQLLDSFF